MSKTPTNAELRKVAKSVGVRSVDLGGTSINQADKKTLRRGIQKRIAIAGGLLVALLLVIIATRQFRRKDYDRAIAAAQSIPPHVRSYIKPTTRQLDQAKDQLKEDEKALKKVCKRLKRGELTPEDKALLIALSAKYEIYDSAGNLVPRKEFQSPGTMRCDEYRLKAARFGMGLIQSNALKLGLK